MVLISNPEKSERCRKTVLKDRQANEKIIVPCCWSRCLFPRNHSAPYSFRSSVLGIFIPQQFLAVTFILDCVSNRQKPYPFYSYRLLHHSSLCVLSTSMNPFVVFTHILLGSFCSSCTSVLCYFSSTDIKIFLYSRDVLHTWHSYGNVFYSRKCFLLRETCLA